MLELVVLDLGDLDLLLDLRQVDVGDGVVAVEDLGDLLEGGALGLDEDEPDPDELDEVPELAMLLAHCLLEESGFGALTV